MSDETFTPFYETPQFQAGLYYDGGIVVKRRGQALPLHYCMSTDEARALADFLQSDEDASLAEVRTLFAWVDKTWPEDGK